MYTAKLLGDTKNIELRRRMVNVEFTNGTTTFNKEFQFSINATLEEMKKVVNEYLNELNYIPPAITDFEYTEPATPTKTTAELAKEEWRADWVKLQTVQELIAAGILTGTETPVVTLQNKVKIGFKASYL